MNISTTRFGPVDVSPEALIELPQGLIGFPSLTRFAVLEPDAGSVFRWWQSVDAPDAAFVVLDVAPVLPFYDLSGLDAEWSDLGVTDPASRYVVVLVTAPGPGLESVTLNLAAPIVVNLATRQGRQLVLPEGRYDAAIRLDAALAPKKPVELAA